MKTINDLKQALDSGETLVDSVGRQMWKAPFPNKYTISNNLKSVTLHWDDILYLVNPSPSDWRIRDQITTEPTIMAVPIAEWNALQEEVKELRGEKKMTPEMVEWWKKTLPC